MGMMADRINAKLKTKAEPVAYHGSPYDFDEFHLGEQSGGGEGAMSYGYGTYLSTDKNDAGGYKGEKNGKLYEVDIIPDDGLFLRWHDPTGTSLDEVLRWANSLPEGKGTQASRNTMSLKEKYQALKASGRISATGRTEEILAEDDWVRVKRMAVPEIDADSYIFTECKRETAVCIVRDADGRFLMRNEATLQSNFTPAPKVMTETLEEGETAEQAATRGLLEEFNGAPVEPLIYLGSINGTFQELHNYHIFLADGDFLMASEDFEGDGSMGEDRSNNITITEAEFAQVKDFISWIAFGMMKQYDNRNILERTVLCQ